MPNKKVVACCSGGKDSVCDLIIGHQNGEQLDEVVYSEVMFDKDTSGEMPEHRDFIYQKLKPFVETKLKVPFIILRSEKTFVDYFEHTISRGEQTGIIAGYPIPGMCGINRDCKIPPIRKYLKDKGTNVIQRVGIAADETARLKRLEGTSKVSLLAKYGVTEEQAFEIVKNNNLLSSVYDFSSRNGCWFCCNCQDREWSHLINKHESLFDKLIMLEEKHPLRYRQMLTRCETAAQIKARILTQPKQLTIFD